MGRTLKLDRETANRVRGVLLSSITASIEDALIVVGISRPTHYRYLEQAKADDAKGRKKRTIFQEYRDNILKAQIERRVVREQKIVKAGEKSWQATAWALERSDPKRYSPKLYLMLGEELKGAVQRLIEEFESNPTRVITQAEALERALGAIAGEHRSGGAGEDPGDEGSGEGGEVDPGGEAVQPGPPEPQAASVPES